MKSCEQYLTAIHELIDGTLGPLRRAELELHLESCDGCRALAADLQDIARAARTLETVPPPAGVWNRVADRLRQEGRVAAASPWHSRRWQTVAALAAALVLAAGASVFLLVPRHDAPPAGEAAAAAPGADGADAVQVVASELALTERHFQNAIERATGSDSLVNSETAAVLQKNLLVVNEAIAESRAALEANPESTPARQSLYDALRQKIQFLHDTMALMNVIRQGDAAGAAELVDGGKS